MPAKDITDQRFGHLLVLRQDLPNKRGQRKWICQCDCGNNILVLGYNLLNGHIAGGQIASHKPGINARDNEIKMVASNSRPPFIMCYFLACGLTTGAFGSGGFGAGLGLSLPLGK
jgi:hypothetical protein